MIMKSLEKIHEIKGKKYVFRVENSDKHQDYIKYEQLRNKVWDQPNDNLSGSRNMMCENFLHSSGAVVFSALIEEENTPSMSCFSKAGFTAAKNIVYWSKREATDL